MRACIHRGAREVGGSCLELEADGYRLVIDIGLPLEISSAAKVPLPSIDGLEKGGNDRLLGVLISHGHADHAGLVGRIHESVPIYAGAATASILAEADFFARRGARLKLAGELRDRATLELGPFRATPFLVDHSGFDTYALMVDAGGRRLFYSSDLRLHGRKAKTVQRLLADPPEADVLVLEGTRISSTGDGSEKELSEQGVEEAALEFLEATEGLALLLFSPQNIDRLVSLFRAAKRASRIFVYDLYAAEVARATGRKTIPQAEWPEVRVYLPKTQMKKVVTAGAFSRTKRILDHRIYPEEIARRPNHYAILFRLELGQELQHAGCLVGARALWSEWEGYLARRSGRELQDWLADQKIPLKITHAAGHAPLADLQRIAAAFAPARVVPMHTEAPERFAEFFTNVEQHADGEWWEV